MFHYFMHMLSSEPQFNYPFSSSWLQVSGHSLHFVHVSIKITPLGVYLYIYFHLYLHCCLDVSAHIKYSVDALAK